ncbi:MAG: ISKra4 family transposase [Cyanobacteria bacterium J06639_1]
MSPEQQARLQACLQEAAAILYADSDPATLTDLEAIETQVRRQMLTHVGPQFAGFFIQQSTGTSLGKPRQLRSCVGQFALTQAQAERLQLRPRTRLSPLLEKCCLNLSAQSSFAQAERDIELLVGVRVGHSTQHALVQRQELSLPECKQTLADVCVDGGKVRLRTPIGDACEWRDYTAVRLSGIYYGARFRDPLTLHDWVNSQPMSAPLVCLGDAHVGVWKFISHLATREQRVEILDWYHLKENLYKVEGSLKRLQQAQSDLWRGRWHSAVARFETHTGRQAHNFVAYLERHRHRLVNYEYVQAEQIAPIGSGAVESAIKQIAHRMKLSGAQWDGERVNAMLNVRCAYLNGAYALGRSA